MIKKLFSLKNLGKFQKKESKGIKIYWKSNICQSLCQHFCLILLTSINLLTI